ncbi:geranylgeranylglyceryl phosphate synthase-like protein [Halogeometricum borinquense DSM 11551]|uniref:Geranylgeranylglyceryl phosphate synthase n=2 Tax=Halogeometricum borinquense TaxID=60847 RepID=E4NQD1_HALBP|nr:heptaprenylglyceryl phosphate synthase [Halogeometricum borinquense]ADQ67804.1 geranylgeranylglyceryl diphosphate synthase [Halogeometricum borinquense DSM 11551]ELY23514.1 geranylgeranylglyceryl phosphate synthase-like protein [Halogeometricum borinquense DSM 11551]RYJ13250.1 heptaprenylglyceryl phosphate synthase [Halogeometricum borinquense]
MDLNWDRLSHVTKIDPAEHVPNDLELLDGTDLVIVGGSDGVTAENTLDAVQKVKSQFPDLPVLQEPYRSSHVSSKTVDTVDYLSVPAVFNGDDAHFVRKHVELFTEAASKPDEVTGSGLPVVGDAISSKAREAVSELATKIIGEGYVIQNCDSKAAAVSGVETPYTTEEVAGAALAAESFYGFPIFYIEYSGTYGGPTDVAAASQYLDETVLLYGGGIETHEQTAEILDAGADAVVVGDCFHDDPEQYRQTIP